MPHGEWVVVDSVIEKEDALGVRLILTETVDSPRQHINHVNLDLVE